MSTQLVFFSVRFKVSVIQFGPYCNTGGHSVEGGVSWGVMINYVNYFGGSTFFLHLEWRGSAQNW